VERLHDELRDARLARERAQEETQTERLRYMQILEEFSRRYDRFLDAPRATAPRSPQEAPGATQTPEPPEERGTAPGHAPAPASYADAGYSRRDA